MRKYEEIDSLLDLFLESSKSKDESKTLSEIIALSDLEDTSTIYTSEKPKSISINKTRSKPFVHERLDEIIELINQNQVDRTDFVQLHKNQEQILFEIKAVQEQNNALLSEVSYLKKQNNSLKELLLNNTSDKRIRSIAAAFLILFSVSLTIFYTSNFELVNISWTKVGIIVSLGVYLIGFFIGKMVKKIEIRDGKS